MLMKVTNGSHCDENNILKVGLPMSKFHADPTKKSTSGLDSPLKVMLKYKTLSKHELQYRPFVP